MTDRKVTRIFSAAILAVLLITLFLPSEESGRIIAAFLLLSAAVAVPIFIKKRAVLSINKSSVLMIMAVAALVFAMIYYLTGFKFGFYKNPYKISVINFFKYVLPIATIIVSSEIIRYVMVSQKERSSHILCYFSCVVAEVLICSNIPAVTTFNRFIDLFAGTLFPAIISNLFYNYLSKRYGMYPNIAFRLIFTLHAYIMPITSGISDSLVSLFDLFIPIALFLFIDLLYERKRKYALGRKSRFWRISAGALTVAAVAIMISAIMLVSNQFKHGALVIATESMTGELNKGDAAIYERYDDQEIIVGQVIAFEKNDRVVIHRVADIQIINGQTRYFTKGDANEDMDSGFIYDSDIIGLINFKIPFIGYPTLWLRSLFSR